MSDALVNRLIVAIARTLGCSPLIAHCLLMLCVTLGFAVMNPEGPKVFAMPFFVAFWFGICAFVVLMTWLTKGELRKAWTQAEPWKKL